MTHSSKHAPIGSISFSGGAGGPRVRVSGWAGSASAAKSPSSTSSFGGRRIRASRYGPETSRPFRPSVTASPSTPIHVFPGKGLYDVDAFIASLDGRVPENALLSHDLFEGLYARTALVTDIEVVDDYPSSVLAHARRQHRWVRGDWQILWWLFPVVPTRSGLRRNRLPLISRWKILDNLRRSLMAPATVALLLLGWTVLPRAPIAWTAIGLAALALPLLLRLFQLLGGPTRLESGRAFLRTTIEDFDADAVRAS